MIIDTHNKPVVIVTGAYGFVGSHLVDRLLAQGKFIIAVDNLCTGQISNLDTSNNMYVHIGDVCNDGIEDYFDYIGVKKVESIYYLASPASPVHYLKMPLQTIRANTIGLENFLKMAKLYKCPILFTSTSEVYGDPQVDIQYETYNGNVNPMGDRSVYDEAKRLGETYMMTYLRQFGVQSKIVRLFNTYGPRMATNDGRVIPTFINQALQNEEMTVMGTGEQTRSFCYIDDTINGILAVMEKCPVGEAYNIGNPWECYSIEKLADIVHRLIMPTTGPYHSRNIDFISQNDPQKRRPNIQKIHNQTGWEPSTSIEFGLIQTIDYFKKLPKKEESYQEYLERKCRSK